jgi:hypothetical protein
VSQPSHAVEFKPVWSVDSAARICDKAAMSTPELIAKEVTKLPEPLQRQVYDFARFLRLTHQKDSFNGLLLSETAFAKDWDSPEEDAAWASL